MRIALIATTMSFAFLAACGGPQDGQANDVQANVSGEAPTPASTTSTNLPGMIGAAVSKEDAQRAMHERHEAMEKIGKATKAASRELKSDNPNLETVRASAATISENAKSVGPLFPKGSGPEAGKTGAKPEIWATPEDFTIKIADFQKAAQAFETAAAGTDVAAIKKSFADLGGTCKSCHDKYRKEMKH